MIFSSNTAKFGFPEVNIGLIPGAGGTQRLTSIVGKYKVCLNLSLRLLTREETNHYSHKAMEMIMLGKLISGQDALALGLVNALSDAGTVLDQAIEVATNLTNKSFSAVKLAKEAVNRGKITAFSSIKSVFGLIYAATNS
jgi:enoyl-CoA hydratase/carnithine racemase